MNKHLLGCGKMFTITNDFPVVLNELIKRRFDKSSDEQLRRLRHSTLESVMSTNDKQILEIVKNPDAIISLLRLVREIEEFVTYDVARGGMYNFHIACDNLKFYIEKRSYAPRGNASSPYRDFIEEGHGYKASFQELYAAYIVNAVEAKLPTVSQIAFNKGIKAYYPDVIVIRENDLRRTRSFQGIRIKPPTAPTVSAVTTEDDSHE